MKIRHLPNLATTLSIFSLMLSISCGKSGSKSDAPATDPEEAEFEQLIEPTPDQAPPPQKKQNDSNLVRIEKEINQLGLRFVVGSTTNDGRVFLPPQFTEPLDPLSDELKTQKSELMSKLDQFERALLITSKDNQFAESLRTEYTKKASLAHLANEYLGKFDSFESLQTQNKQLRNLGVPLDLAVVGNRKTGDNAKIMWVYQLKNPSALVNQYNAQHVMRITAAMQKEIEGLRDDALFKDARLWSPQQDLSEMLSAYQGMLKSFHALSIHRIGPDALTTTEITFSSEAIDVLNGNYCNEKDAIASLEKAEKLLSEQYDQQIHEWTSFEDPFALTQGLPALSTASIDSQFKVRRKLLSTLKTALAAELSWRKYDINELNDRELYAIEVQIYQTQLNVSDSTVMSLIWQMAYDEQIYDTYVAEGLLDSEHLRERRQVIQNKRAELARTRTMGNQL